MCYQPIANSETGHIVGMEALLRWKHKEFGVVPPGIFIPWLEMEPCFFELGNWIIEQALTDGMEIRRIRPDFVVNVNISATQLENHGFRQAVVDILKNSIKEQKLAHAYLFSGPRGTGKTSTARILAKSINCLDNKSGIACGKCENCLSFNGNPDIIEIDAASNNGVDEIRELINNVKIMPTSLKLSLIHI